MLTPSMSPRVENPIIPNLKEHLFERIIDLAKSTDKEKTQKYDTAFTWAIVQLMQKES